MYMSLSLLACIRRVAIALVFLVFVCTGRQVTLRPRPKGATRITRHAAALIMVTGHKIASQQYVPIAGKIQESLETAELWVSIIDASEDFAVVRNALVDDGLPRSAPMFVLGG
jgi:hypothetical protein